MKSLALAFTTATVVVFCICYIESTNGTEKVPASPFPPFNSTLFNKTKLHVGALLPFLLTHDKMMFHAAMYTAMRLINNDSNILKDYELVLDFKETTVSKVLCLLRYLNSLHLDYIRNIIKNKSSLRDYSQVK